MLVNGLGLDTPEARVLDVFGEPLSRSRPEFAELVDDTVSEWSYHDLTIGIAGHRLYELDCRRRDCVTPAGVRVGSTRAAVTKAYGVGFTGFDAQTDVLMYFRQGVACWYAFVLDNDIVTRIELRCDYS
jgi:hypothetical protein